MSWPHLIIGTVCLAACWVDVHYDLQFLAFTNAFVAVGNYAWAWYDFRHLRRRR